MSKQATYMEQQINDLVQTLRTFADNVYADEIAEDEIEALFEVGALHAFVYETGDLSLKNDNRTYLQQLLVYYYSENRTDLDVRTLDIIQSVESNTKGVKFSRAQRERLQKKDTERFVDRVVFLFSRTIPKVGC